MQIKMLLETSIIKTLKFNYHYFGLKKCLSPLVLISKRVKFNMLKGNVIVENCDKGKIKIGYLYSGIIDKKYNRTLWENSGTIIFEGNANISLGSKIVNHGELIFGKNISINLNCNIICYKKIKFGDNCLISWNTLFMDTDFHSIYNNKNEKINNNKDIIVGNHVWVGCNSTILKGTKISDGSVIGAGSIVTKSLDNANSIYASNNIVKENITWDR